MRHVWDRLRATTAFLVAVGLCASAQAAPSTATPVDLSADWIEVAPSDVAIDPQALERAAERATAIPRFRSLLVARHGRLAFERYFAGAGRETLFDVRSVTKSVVSLLTGIAIRDGALPGTAVSIAPYLAPAYRLDAQDAAVQVGHLLTMTSGYAWDEGTAAGYNEWLLSGRHVQYVLDRPFHAAPGAVFTYNSGAVHLLGVVIERAAGEPLPQFARERLFAPLGISEADVVWEELSEGYVNGGSGIDLRGRDLLKLGQLVLQRGASGERSVVGAEWIDAVTHPAFTWRQDYGPQRSTTYGGLFWVSDQTPRAFFAWGYGGQFVYVVPELDVVVVATTEWRSLTETTPLALAIEVLGVIVEGVLPAVARP